MSLGFEKFSLTCQKNVFGISKEQIQKNDFSFYFFLEIGWWFILNKKWKNECCIRHSLKKNWVSNESGKKKDDMSGIKRCR